VFLQLLKETRARAGEAYSIKWEDIDLIRRTVTIKPEKEAIHVSSMFQKNCLGYFWKSK